MYFVYSNIATAMAMIYTYPCLFYTKIYNTKKKLQSHKWNRHKNNKFILYCHIFCQPSDETLSFFWDIIIIHLKNSFGFSRHLVKKKHISIDRFSENVFLSLFENKTNFKYILN